RASRSHVAGDSRGTLDRLPSAGAPGGAREARPDVRPHVAGARGGRAWSNLGGGRVLDRALLAHRSGWFARGPKIFRIDLSPRFQGGPRGDLPLDLREERGGAARGGEGGRPQPARLRAQVRRSPARGPGRTPTRTRSGCIRRTPRAWA